MNDKNTTMHISISHQQFKELVKKQPGRIVILDDEEVNYYTIYDNNLQWILCSEQLPKVDTDVLLAFEYNMAVGYLEAVTEGGECWWAIYTDDDYYSFAQSTPVAWMPLPEPYEQK